ncbi:hypothetical protein OBBRIDRAFT_807923 [Obba rivulosa]|uniref:Uncharacterized protein n=1 Tax=Obba rivulosa TaxID=1052685 RepID=A0A8E2DGJ4_9APHY|nr:hypothetical protein OBBRIDRAFT_807923 [Obba rivulosa]
MTYMGYYFPEDFVFPDLARFASTLETLRLKGTAGNAFRVPSAPCSKLQTLSMESTRLADLHSLTTTFPNLRELKYQLSIDFLRGHDHELEQLASSDLSSQRDDMWPLTDSVTSNVQSLRVLNWIHHIRHLIILHWTLVRYLNLARPYTLRINFDRIDRLDWLSYVTSVVERYTELSNLVVDMLCDANLARQDAPSLRRDNKGKPVAAALAPTVGQSILNEHGLKTLFIVPGPIERLFCNQVAHEFNSAS